MPVPLESCIPALGVTQRTYLSYFLCALCVNDDTRTTNGRLLLFRACSTRLPTCWLRAFFLSSRSLSVQAKPTRKPRRNLGLLTLQTSRLDASRGRISARSLPAARILETNEVLPSESNRAFLHTGPVTDLLNATGFRTRVCSLSRHRSPDPFTVHRSLDRLVPCLRVSDSSLSLFFFFFFVHPRSAAVVWSLDFWRLTRVDDE